MNRSHTILKGAFILTITGFSTRLIGFFYRIFLSQVFGEEGIGIYQLIFPVYALGFSLTCAGIEIALSRTVAQKTAIGKPEQAKMSLYTGCVLSMLLSLLFMFLVQKESNFIACQLLNEPRCEPLLVVISYALPFSALHSCIYGYFLGLKTTKTPAISQFIEQIIRVGSVFLLYRFSLNGNHPPNILIAVSGIVFGEFASSLFCFLSYRYQKQKTNTTITFPAILRSTKELLHLSIPLTGNRALLNILQSLEAVSIPIKLQLYGYNVSQSLSIYGVLTGMALPCILFPSALTNSIAAMILPTVAELQTTSNKHFLFSMIKKVSLFCSALGSICCALFIITGSYIGNHVFHSDLAGDFLITMAWMCPFLYTNSNLISIINGLGKTFYSFVFNVIGLSLRIGSIYYLIPLYGIRGYLSGLLSSQLIVFILCIGYLYRFSRTSPK